MELNIPFRDRLNEELKCPIFQRKLILWLRYVKKLNPSTVAQEVDKSVKTIFTFLAKWADTGVVEDLPRSGRPLEYSKLREQQVINIQKKKICNWKRCP